MILDLYHEYFYDCLNVGEDPLGFQDWLETVFRPFYAGRELFVTVN